MYKNLLHSEASELSRGRLLRGCCVLSVAQSCRTLCDPKNYRLHGSSVHGIFQARILEWISRVFKLKGECLEYVPESPGPDFAECFKEKNDCRNTPT